MRLIEPLQDILDSLIRSGERHPLTLALGGFGTPNGYAAIADEIARVPLSEPVVLDLTPFDRVGRFEPIQRHLAMAARTRPIVMLARKGIDDDVLTKLSEATEIIIIQYDGNQLHPELLLASARKYEGEVARDTIQFIQRHPTLNEFHRRLTADKVAALAAGSLIVPHTMDERFRKTVDGSEFIALANGMVVSSFLHTKALLGRRSNLFSLAFETLRVCSNCFLPTAAAETAIDFVVAPTNGSLTLASAVHALSEIPVAVVDRLGPLPARRISSINTSADLAGKRVNVIVEVAATGSEIDRTLQYLDYRRASVDRVICCYHWGAGHPSFADRRPSKCSAALESTFRLCIGRHKCMA